MTRSTVTVAYVPYVQKCYRVLLDASITLSYLYKRTYIHYLYHKISWNYVRTYNSNLTSLFFH